MIHILCLLYEISVSYGDHNPTHNEGHPHWYHAYNHFSILHFFSGAKFPSTLFNLLLILGLEFNGGLVKAPVLKNYVSEVKIFVACKSYLIADYIL